MKTTTPSAHGMGRIEMLFCTAAILVAATLTLAINGCKHPELPGPATNLATINALLRTGAASAGYYGLQQYGKKNPAEAMQAAQAVNQITNGIILPYLNGAALKSGAVVDAFLKQNLAQLPPEVKFAVTLAAGALDAYLPAPGADTYLTEAQVGYLKAFFSGLKEGADMYVENKEPKQQGRASTTKGAWLRFE